MTVDGVLLRVGRPDEADRLTDLAMRSKAFWGYDDAFMAACRDELTVDPSTCERGQVMVVEVGGVVVGYAQIEPRGEAVELRSMFVDPGAIGSGVGRVLMEAVSERARGGAPPGSSPTPTRTRSRSTPGWGPSGSARHPVARSRDGSCRGWRCSSDSPAGVRTG